MSEGEVGGLENKEVEYDGKNMEAIVVLLNFLHDRMDRVRTDCLNFSTIRVFELPYLCIVSSSPASTSYSSTPTEVYQD